MTEAFLRDVEIHFSVTGVCLMVLDLYFYFRAYNGFRLVMDDGKNRVHMPDEYNLMIVSVIILLHAYMYATVSMGSFFKLNKRKQAYSGYNWALLVVAIFMIANQIFAELRSHFKDPGAEVQAIVHSVIVIVLWLIILLASVVSVKVWYIVFCCCCCKRYHYAKRPPAETSLEHLTVEVREEFGVTVQSLASPSATTRPSSRQSGGLSLKLIE